MTTEELLDFCSKREVEIFTRYDFISDSLIIKMRKRDVEVETSEPREIVGGSGFGLTVRIILRDMANRLDDLIGSRGEKSN